MATVEINPLETIVVTPLWTSASHAEDGGRKTHDTLDENTARCGTPLEHLLADTGDPRRVTADDVGMHIDCGRCLRSIEAQFARLRDGVPTERRKG